MERSLSLSCEAQAPHLLCVFHSPDMAGAHSPQMVQSYAKSEEPSWVR